MVRINIINPKSLADQHLIAEYNEILMLMGYARKYKNLPYKCPERYCLGNGHIIFFKNKLGYLKRRHEMLKKEMQKRGFRTSKTISLKYFPERMKNNWAASEKDKNIIKKRIIEKIRLKPAFYRYYGKKRKPSFLINLINNS
jgi:deoxyribonuclease (pyrimidine dimer)